MPWYGYSRQDKKSAPREPITAKLVAENNPADVTAMAALAYEQDGYGPTLEDVRKGLIGKIGENMSIRRFKRYAGGGSLARVETGGGLRVGPQSAGAVPGPACYARGGTLPTVTDANLVLGRLSASRSS